VNASVATKLAGDEGCDVYGRDLWPFLMRDKTQTAEGLAWLFKSCLILWLMIRFTLVHFEKDIESSTGPIFFCKLQYSAKK
jgi:hypothetical protein